MHKPSWFAFLTFCLTAALAVSLAFATLLAGATLAFGRGQSPDSPTSNLSTQTFAGLITDSRCGARHATDSGKNTAECARSCVRHGARYVLVDGESRYMLAGNKVVLDGLAGQRAQVQGTLAGDVLTVASAKVQ